MGTQSTYTVCTLFAPKSRPASGSAMVAGTSIYVHTCPISRACLGMSGKVVTSWRPGLIAVIPALLRSH